MNKRGFAISVILYSIVILVIGILYLLLGIVRNRYTIGDKLKSDVIDYVNIPMNVIMPTISVSMTTEDGSEYITDKWTNQNIYVNLNLINSNVGIYEYQRYVNNEWTSEGIALTDQIGTISYLENINETVKFRGVDNIGNISEEVVVVLKKDDISPTCDMDVSDTGLITATYNDNGGSNIGYYGFNSGYSGTSILTKQLSGGGSSTYYVKDNAGNTNTCSINVATKTQYRYRDCSSCKRCTAAGCASYGNWSWIGYACRGSGSGTDGDRKYTCTTSETDGCEPPRNYNCTVYSGECVSKKSSCSKCGGCSTWGSWSGYGDIVYTSSSSRDVQTRTYYYKN